MKVHKWSSMWFVWYKRYKVLGMVLLVLAAGIFVFCDKLYTQQSFKLNLFLKSHLLNQVVFIE